MGDVVELDTQKVDVFENGWLLRGSHGRYSLSRGLDAMKCIDSLDERDLEQLMLLLSHFRITKRKRGGARST